MKHRASFTHSLRMDFPDRNNGHTDKETNGQTDVSLCLFVSLPFISSPGVKDVFVWLTGTPAPNDFLFVVCYANALTYLLTYLLT